MDTVSRERNGINKIRIPVIYLLSFEAMMAVMQKLVHCEPVAACLNVSVVA